MTNPQDRPVAEIIACGNCGGTGVIRRRKGSLTSRTRRILDCIIEFKREYQYSPSIREIAWRVGLSSPATVHAHLRKLEDMGLITRGVNP